MTKIQEEVRKKTTQPLSSSLLAQSLYHL